jgi:hypothetical protein
MDTSIISIGQNNIQSEVIKQIIGPRTIDLWQTYRINSRGASRRQRLGGFANFLGQGLLDYLMSNMTQIVMGSLLQLYMFDWNKSDKEIKDQMNANELAMISAAGRLVADGAVRFTTMGLVKQAKHRYPRIDPMALANLEEENQEELVSAITSFLIASRSNLLNNAWLSTYMSGRQMLFGAQSKKTESFIISDQIEKIVEAQKDPKIKAFWQGFTDQAEDAIFDLAFLVCNTVQATYEMNKMAAKQASGPSRFVQFTPDKDAPEVKAIIYGTQEAVMTAITSATIQQAVLDNKDIGEIVQVGMDKALRAERNERLITAYFYSGNNGATTLPSGARAQQKKLRISNVKNTVDWDDLKRVLVPIDGGNYKVIAHLDDGHQLQGFFATEADGRSYLTNVATLCKGDITKWTTIEPNSDPKFRMDPARFEIATATYRVAKKTSDPAKKDMIDAKGQFWRVKAIRLKLRATEKPDGIDAELLNPWFAESP